MAPTAPPVAAFRRGGTPPPARSLSSLALALALLLVAALAALPLAHDDLFQHLATGRHIAATGRVPTADFLSHTRAGAPWVSHEWGFSVLTWAVWRAAGMPGLLLLKVLLALALALSVALLARRLAGPDAGAGLPLAAVLTVAAAWAVSRELILRAALAGAVLLALFALALLAFRRRPGWRRGAAVVAVGLLWANLHSGVLFGLFLLALFVAEAAWRAARQGSVLRRGLPWLGLLVACAAASLVNPNGLTALLYPLRLARLLADPASGFTVGHFAGGWAGREGLLGLLVAALLGGWLLLLRRRPMAGDADGGTGADPAGTAKRVGSLTAGLPPAWLVACLVFAVLSWRTSRLGVELVVLVVPAAYAVWSRWAAGRGGWPRRSAAWLAGLALAAAVVLGAGTLAARPAGVVSRHFPAGAVAFLRQHGVQGHLFNHQNWGGYLYWHLHQPVFWDGRNLVFASLVREVTTTPFETVARRYGVGTLVIGPGEAADLRAVLVSGRWRLVYGDALAAVYVRAEVGGGE
jgi:hypothetical protein